MSVGMKWKILPSVYFSFHFPAAVADGSEETFQKGGVSKGEWGKGKLMRWESCLLWSSNSRKEFKTCPQELNQLSSVICHAF